MAIPASENIPWRIQGAVYACGLFSNSSFQVYNLVVPLWVAMLDLSPFMIGVVLGSRQFLAMALSIHGGAMMDRFGTRRVMLGFAVVAVIVPLLYPLLPWVAPLIVLQMLAGLAALLCWIGAQTMVGQVMAGNPAYAGRLSLSTRLGSVMAPPLAGAMWDVFGPWGAFGVIAVWGAGIFVAAWMLPVAEAPDTPEAKQEPEPEPVPRQKVRLGDLIPKWQDYRDAFRLFAVPTIAFVVLVTVMRHSGVAMQSTFYVVYLGEIGISGTLIGILFSVAGLCGGGGSLLAAPLTRILNARWLILLAAGITVTMLAITPLLGGYVLLLVAMGMRGLGTGISQTLEITLIGQSAGPESQGKGAALRVSAGRVAALIVPVVIGAIAEVAGIENSFYIIGALVVGALAIAGLGMSRMSDFTDNRTASR